MRLRGSSSTFGIGRLVSALFLITGFACAQLDPGSARPDLAQASLEELMSVKISSLSRKDQKLSQTPAAISVITPDDIRRSGATTIPEALRLVPGLAVGRIGSSVWAISSRGFNGRFANKMLVMIDGRTIYNNIYSGVYWEQYDLLMEEIERIEVIRGPGATVWGANAVNGVINIITKSARNAQGGLVTMGTSNEERAYVGGRFGGRAGKKVAYRMSMKLLRLGDQVSGRVRPGQPGVGAGDTFDTERGGARVEWQISPRDTLTVHGDLYRGDYRTNSLETLAPLVAPNANTTPEIVDVEGGFLQARWQRKGERSETAVQWYFDSASRNEALGSASLRNLDLDFQQRYALRKRHDLVWGMGYRRLDDRLDTRVAAAALFRPVSTGQDLYSSFLQDDIALKKDKLVLTVGSRLLHNFYSGFAVQPGVRLLWTPTANNGLWASVSRAVRTPARKDTDIDVRFAVPQFGAGVQVRYLGSREFANESVVAYEGGYRHQFRNRLSADVAVFTSRYSDLQSFALGNPYFSSDPGVRLVVPLRTINGPGAISKGLEVATNWKASYRWRLGANYTFYHVRSLATSTQPLTLSAGSTTPAHQVQAHSSFDFTRKLSLDVFGYSVSRTHPEVPNYLRLDTRLSWRPHEALELALGGRNLLDPHHPEFIGEDFLQSGQIRRSAYVRATWRF